MVPARAVGIDCLVLHGTGGRDDCVCRSGPILAPPERRLCGAKPQTTSDFGRLTEVRGLRSAETDVVVACPQGHRPSSASPTSSSISILRARLTAWSPIR